MAKKVTREQNQSGRRTETVVSELNEDNATKRVVEYYEEKVPLELKSRILEKVQPVVVERIVESVDENGVTQKHVEVVPGQELELRQAKEDKLDHVVSKFETSLIKASEILEQVSKDRSSENSASSASFDDNQVVSAQEVIRARAEETTNKFNLKGVLTLVICFMASYLIWVLVLRDLIY